MYIQNSTLAKWTKKYLYTGVLVFHSAQLSLFRQEFDAADRTSYIDDVFALAR